MIRLIKLILRTILSQRSIDRLRRIRAILIREQRRVRYQLRRKPRFPPVVYEPRPIVLISACKDAEFAGDNPYNGGTKLFNLWAKLIRQNGLEAYIVTYDGKYQSWLIDHQPHISLETMKQWVKE